MAATLTQAVRHQDTVARQGGDEFAILAPDTDREGATMLAARVRDRLRGVQFAGDSIAATVGLAVYPADGVTTHALLARADSQLLGAKSGGRVSSRIADAVGGPDPRRAVGLASRSAG